MSVCPTLPDSLNFPLEVHFKIIGEDSADLRTHLEIALCELAIHEELIPGNASAAGKYKTYNLTVVVANHVLLNEIDARLRAVPGVKMVL